MTDEHDECARQLRFARADLALLRGQGLQPARGCRIARLILGDADALVEYEYFVGSPANYDADSPLVGPECPEEITVLRVYLNGHWCDVQDCIRDEVIERWADDIREIERELAEEFEA
jgi:hypothetical protein